MHTSRHKLVRSITPEELDTLLERLASETNVTGARIRELADEMYGVEIGHDSANNFRNDVFGEYLRNLSASRDRARMIASMGSDAAGKVISDAASQMLQQQLFEFMLTAKLDFNKAEDLEKAEALARIIKGARLEDRKMIAQLEAQLEAAKEKEAQTATAVMAAAKEKGASPQLVSAIREAMNFRPKPAAASSGVPSEASAKEGSAS
ncbi:MAG: phage protein Gp27 family protein [Verrucomicrobiota bacterium]